VAFGRVGEAVAWPRSARIGDLHGSAALHAQAERVIAGQTGRYNAADELVTTLTAS
jgi:hypothetical protein